MMVQVVEKWEANLQAQPASSFKDRQSGETVSFEAQEARTAIICLVQNEDGSRLAVEIPAGYDSEINESDKIDIECKALVDAFTKKYKVKNVLRHSKAK